MRLLQQGVRQHWLQARRAFQYKQPAGPAALALQALLWMRAPTSEASQAQPHLHPRVLQQIHVDAVEALQLRILLAQEGGPVQGGLPAQLPPARMKAEDDRGIHPRWAGQANRF